MVILVMDIVAIPWPGNDLPSPFRNSAIAAAAAAREPCPYRKLDPDVLMVQPTKHRLSFDTPVTLNGPSIGRILP
jgi:hypothetical protein